MFLWSFDFILFIILSTFSDNFKEFLALIIFSLYFFDHSPLLLRSGRSIISLTSGLLPLDELFPLSLDKGNLPHNSAGLSKISINSKLSL